MTELELKAPDQLSKEAVFWWDQIVAAYVLDDPAAMLLLQTAMESFDRMRQAQAAINEYGAVFKDRFDQLKNNPACIVERDSRSQMLMSLKALNLDIEPLQDGPGRPSGR